MIGSVWRLGLCAVGISLTVASAAAAQDPYLQANESWISLDGTVATASANQFILDYGDGLITVEMDDESRDPDAYALLPGDEVIVTGKVDADFFEATTIEASSVYLKEIGIRFYASPADEEESPFVHAPVDTDRTVLRGVVTDVNENRVQLQTGDHQITVAVDELRHGPLDDQRSERIEIGDYVSVAGEIDQNLFERRVFVAEVITRLVEAIPTEEFYPGR